MAFDFKKLSTREKTLLGVLLLAVSTLPIFQFTLPAWKNYIESSIKIKNDKTTLQNLSTRIKALEKLKNENIKISRKLEEQKLYLAKSYEIDFLVQDLKKICDESLISLESFTPSNPEPVNIVLEKQTETAGSTQDVRKAVESLKGKDLPIDLYRFPIEVKVTGDFTDIIELFNKLEKYGRVISVENISIGKIQSKQTSGNRLSKSKSKKQSTDTGSLLSTFELVAYSLPSGEESLSVKKFEKNLYPSMSSFRFKQRR